MEFTPDTDKAFGVVHMQIRSMLVGREIRGVDRPDLFAGTPLLEALNAIVSNAAARISTPRRWHTS